MVPSTGLPWSIFDNMNTNTNNTFNKAIISHLNDIVSFLIHTVSVMILSKSIAGATLKSNTKYYSDKNNTDNEMIRQEARQLVRLGEMPPLTLEIAADILCVISAARATNLSQIVVLAGSILWRPIRRSSREDGLYGRVKFGDSRLNRSWDILPVHFASATNERRIMGPVAIGALPKKVKIVRD